MGAGHKNDIHKNASKIWYAGNRLQEAGAIVGLQEGCRLCGLDLSRNLVATSNQNSRPFHRLLTLLKHLQLLSLLGNPACLSPG